MNAREIRQWLDRLSGLSGVSGDPGTKNRIDVQPMPAAIEDALDDLALEDFVTRTAEGNRSDAEALADMGRDDLADRCGSCQRTASSEVGRLVRRTGR